MVPLPPGPPSRRSLLRTGAAGLTGLGAVGALALTTGCSGGDRAERERRAAERGARLRRAAAADSAVLLRRYDATSAAHPDLAARLAPLRADVLRHAEAFGDGRRGGPDASPPPGAEVPKERAAALAELAGAERRTARERMRALADAPPELARLLASVAASGEVHAFLLGEATGGGA
ncbi:lipoprotein [Streptomyces chumphonensis]